MVKTHPVNMSKQEGTGYNAVCRAGVCKVIFDHQNSVYCHFQLKKKPVAIEAAIFLLCMLLFLEYLALKLGHFILAVLNFFPSRNELHNQVSI